MKNDRRSKFSNLSNWMCGFMAQLVEHRTGIAEVTGSNPVEALTGIAEVTGSNPVEARFFFFFFSGFFFFFFFFRLLLSNCSNWKISGSFDKILYFRCTRVVRNSNFQVIKS